MMTKEEILHSKEHRPFPLPNTPWVMQQSWADLLFIHYKIPYETLRSFVPQELEIDTFHGEAWISISPFKMRDVRLRLLPPIPTTANFLELNLRTYVKVNGRGGIYFFSLDASSPLSVLGARMGAFLPYFRADMAVDENGEEFHFHSERKGDKKTPAVLDVKYKPVSPPLLSEKESLDEWLVERYCLYQKTVSDKIIEIDIHHLPWALQQVEGTIQTNSLLQPFDLTVPEQQPLMHYSKFMKVLIYPLKIVKPH